MGILWISCRNEVPILYYKRLPHASPMHEIASLLEYVDRLIFHILGIGPVIVSQSPRGQVVTGSFQSFSQPGEPSPIQHTSPRFRIDRPRQHPVTDRANHFVLFEELQRLVL